MKIVYIALKSMSLGGGIEKYTAELGSRLVRLGHEVIVYAMRHYGAKDGIHEGMQVRTVPAVATRSMEKMSAAFMASLAQIREPDVDIVHFHAFGPSMFSFIPRLQGRRVVVQGHGLEWTRARWGWLGKSFLRLSEIPSVRFPHVVTVVSMQQQNYLRRRYGIESVFIPPGVNPPERLPPRLIREQYGLNGNDYILFASRLVREKGAHYLVSAYRKLRPDLKLVIAGDAQHEESYKSSLRALAENDPNIVFPGFVTGPVLGELMSNCRIFVLPSETEGLPMVLLEAMSYGCCCLVSDIPENREALEDCGHTFHTRDVDSLTAELRRLLSDPAQADAVREKARARALRDYSWDMVAGRFDALYRSLLKPS